MVGVTRVDSVGTGCSVIRRYVGYLDSTGQADITIKRVIIIQFMQVVIIESDTLIHIVRIVCSEELSQDLNARLRNQE